MRRSKQKKLAWKKAILKAIELGLRKALELIILAFVLGMAYKVFFIAISATTVSAVVVLIFKYLLIE
jgi:hypothetical protein